MADTKSATEREATLNRAQRHFAASEQRDDQIKQMVEKERAATNAKTAKLRALRLAKEEADHLAAVNVPPAESTKNHGRKSRGKAS